MILLDASFSLTLIFELFPWTNVMQLSKLSLVRWRRFHGYHCPDGNTCIKNADSFKKYSKFTPTIHINPKSYSFTIMFIMIIVRFFIICFINGWNYEKVAINWNRVTNWCVYLITQFYRLYYQIKNFIFGSCNCILSIKNDLLILA